MAKTDWVKVCVNYEHQQRRQARKHEGLIYLGSDFDVGFSNGKYRLVPTRDYFE